MDILSQLWDVRNYELQLAGSPLQDQPPISRQDLCEALGQGNPDPGTCPNGGVDATRVPGLGTTFDNYANLYANGCGDDSATFQVANFIARFTVTGYTGDPNEPLVGFNIGGICNAHDACYAGQVGRSTCDNLFDEALTLQLSSQYVTGSEAFAYAGSVVRAYVGAVGLFGDNPYARATAVFRCAAWNASMDANQCPR